MLFFFLFLAATLREEQTIDVNGIREVWQLQWHATPKPACDSADPMWLTCPCAGFAYGETGLLDLVRLRQGREFERLSLTPLFRDGVAILQRTDPDAAKPSAVRIMKFADYDHDGQATEFYLQTSAGPCGHTQGVVLGVSTEKPKLHAFGTSLHPAQPLVMRRNAWDSLSTAHGPVQVVDWPCEDHGENKQLELRLLPSPQGIGVIGETYACPRTASARPFRREQK